MSPLSSLSTTMRSFGHYLVLLTIVLCAASAADAATAVRREPALVTNVFDGDTVVVDRGGTETTVRLIGVDTPETARPDTPVQFFGPEASEFTRTSLLGKHVLLEFEAPGRPGGSVDVYGRTLAYIITRDGANFDLELVRRGYGRVYARYPFRYQREFKRAERSARASGLGIWNWKRKTEWSDPARRGKIIGNIRSHIYHLPGQEGCDKVLEKNRIYFSNEEEAVTAGFRKARSRSGGSPDRQSDKLPWDGMKE
jgi:micrococcal nuclease